MGNEIIVPVTNGTNSEGIRINGAGSKHLHRGAFTQGRIQLRNLLPQNFTDAKSLYGSVNNKQNSWQKRIT